MKKIICLLVLFSFAYSLVISPVYAEDKQIDIYFFWSESCPHCASEKLHLQTLEQKYSNLVIHSYTISQLANRNLLSALANEYETSTGAVPMTFIGDQVIHGAQLDLITSQVEYCSENTCLDPGSLVMEKIEATNQVSKDAQTNNFFTYGAIGGVVLVCFVALYIIFKK